MVQAESRPWQICNTVLESIKPVLEKCAPVRLLVRVGTVGSGTGWFVLPTASVGCSVSVRPDTSGVRGSRGPRLWQFSPSEAHFWR